MLRTPLSTAVRIRDRIVGPGHPVFVVAEIGANFADLEEAKRQIDEAAAAGCDAVKIQTFRADTLVRSGAFFTFEDGSRASQHDFFRARELSGETHRSVQAYVEERGLVFFSTPSHQGDLDLLESLNVPIHKIGSDDLTNLPFIEAVARTRKPVILSTGMSTLGEVEEALARFVTTGNQNLILLHCLVGYPAPLHEANLRVVETLHRAFGVPVGFSDHTPGWLAAVVAVAHGACVVEKHLTLDRSAGGPDNETSLEPHEMADLVRNLRCVEAVLGDGVKRIEPCEEKWRAAGRKSLVAAKDIHAGEVVTFDMVTAKRPSDGLHPRHFHDMVGRVARVDIAADECFRWEWLDAAPL